MILAKVTLALVLSQYVRSRADDANSQSACLWWVENKTIELHQNQVGNPESQGTDFTAIGNAITTWQTQLGSCASLTLVDGTRTASRFVGYDQTKDATNENVTVFRLKTCADVPSTAACRTGEDPFCGNEFDCWDHAESAIALTTTSYTPSSGRILDSDIEFNTPQFLFTTVDAPRCPANQYALDCVTTDIRNTATHELGHLLGLGHIAIASSTMNASAVPGELSKRALDDGTKQFVCDVYPAGKPSKTCVLRPVDETLGTKPACSCSNVEGLASLAVLGALLRRRRRNA